MSPLLLNTRYTSNPKGQSRMDNPETPSTIGTQDEDKQINKNKTQHKIPFFSNIYIYLHDGECTYDCKLQKFREMLLTTLEHNQHDVIDVI
jgi:hypothetical protein